MGIIRFIKNWTLPIAMLAGVALYYLYVNIPALDATHAAMNRLLGYVQPLLIFVMLFASFCKVSVRELKPQAWMLKMLSIQALGFLAGGLLLILLPSMPGRVVVESFMVCMVCPTATAAAVVTTKLHGSPSVVVSYTCLINLLVSLLVPAVVPLLREGGHADLGFEVSFLLIAGRVFPMLILPLVAAWLVRHLFPRFHQTILRLTDLAFYLWTVALALAIGVTVKAIVHSEENIWNLMGIAVVSLLACVGQFICGRIIGLHHGEPVACAQSMGQKNTIVAIWIGYTFLNPVVAVAGGFYSVWHNVVNSWQLWRERRGFQ